MLAVFSLNTRSVCAACSMPLDVAADVTELNVPGWFLHRLKGDRNNLWSLRVSGNWRITFVFEDGDAEIVNLEDYH